MAEIKLLELSERVFVDRFQGGRTQNLFHLYLQGGKEEYGFVFEMIGAKRLAKLLSQQVEAFEKETGQKLDDTLDNDPQLSPLQLK